jgi:hypothetical protein
VPPSPPHRYSGPGRWNRFRIICQGDRVFVEHNGHCTVDVTADPRLKGVPRRGAIGLQNWGTPVEFRNVFLRELP